jgi:hypothetical protein
MLACLTLMIPGSEALRTSLTGLAANYVDLQDSYDGEIITSLDNNAFLNTTVSFSSIYFIIFL